MVVSVVGVVVYEIVLFVVVCMVWVRLSVVNGICFLLLVMVRVVEVVEVMWIWGFDIVMLRMLWCLVKCMEL